ncbi:MAG: hypothetical protein LBD58_10315 [Treponema sp.]|jgi:hypothetical protein|nr:hypothetical protein [Treponema sp.]
MSEIVRKSHNVNVTAYGAKVALMFSPFRTLHLIQLVHALLAGSDLPPSVTPIINPDDYGYGTARRADGGILFLAGRSRRQDGEKE